MRAAVIAGALAIPFAFIGVCAAVVYLGRLAFHTMNLALTWPLPW